MPRSSRCTYCNAGAHKAHRADCARPRMQKSKLNHTPAQARNAVPVTQQILDAAPPVATKPLVNHIALVIDESGSMDCIKHDLVHNLNSQIRTIKQKAHESGQKTTITVATFNDAVKTRMAASFPEAVQDFCIGGPYNYSSNAFSYSPNGNTALFDAIASTVGALPYEKPGEDTTYLVLILTDGAENRSRQHSVASIAQLLRDKQATDRWTFAFICPGSSVNMIAGFGIPRGNIQPWDGSAQELDMHTMVASASIGSYYTARTKGVTRSVDFFTDATKVDLSKLQNLSHRFAKLKVSAEDEIANFVNVNWAPYRPGMAFYELTKPETVQGAKDVLVMNRKTEHVYGGNEAREMIGIPAGGQVKVKPGNHGDYRIFVRSTSMNRKLVRGTYLLVEK